MSNNSFVENVNNVANATALAAADIVDDTQAARDMAVAAAAEVAADKLVVDASVILAQKWAELGHNTPVTGTSGVDAEYSSFHWATESKTDSEASRLQVIRDGTTASTYTWSSQKISDKLDLKSDTTHLHTGVYEPAFSKKSGFNQYLSQASGLNGSSLNLAREDHVHTDLYEPKVQGAHDVFDKDFGTVSGTVAEGDHNHDTRYELQGQTGSSKLLRSSDIGTGNSNVARGDHSHDDTNLVHVLPTAPQYTPVVNSNTVGGAINELDAQVGSIDYVERSYISAGSETLFAVTIAAANTPTEIVMPLSAPANTYKNASLNNGAGISVMYAVAPMKAIEGTCTATISVAGSDEVSLHIALGGTLIGTSSKNDGGTLSISKVIPNIPPTPTGNDATITFWLTNHTGTTNIDIQSMNVTWSGTPEGAFVMSGATVNHADLTGLGDMVTGVHTISDIKGLQTALDDKTGAISGGIQDNLVAIDANGHIEDSGVPKTIGTTTMSKITAPTTDNIVTMDSGGQSKDGGLKITDLALAQGDALKTFKVAASVNDEDAVNQSQINAMAATYVTDATYQTFIARTDNPHSVTHTQAGAAATVHSHVISDTTGLQDELNAKYTKVSGSPVTNNFVSFGAGDTILDSGINGNGRLLTGEDVV